MDLLYGRNAEDAQRLRVMMSSDDVNEDDNIDDGMEFDGGYVEP